MHLPMQAGAHHAIFTPCQQGPQEEDSQAASHCRRSGRELQRWAPEEGISDPLQTEGLDLHPGKGATWDQFAANEQRFGVRTSYDEDLYTTKLDKGRAKMSTAEAERIAAEIEGQASSASRHLRDDRNTAGTLDEVRFALLGWLLTGLPTSLPTLARAAAACKTCWCP